MAKKNEVIKILPLFFLSRNEKKFQAWVNELQMLLVISEDILHEITPSYYKLSRRSRTVSDPVTQTV